MLGLMVLGIVLGWLAVAIWIARSIARRLAARDVLRPWISTAIATAVFFLPVSDEIASRPAFQKLCRTNGSLHIEAQKIRGRNVALQVRPRNELMVGTLIPTYHSRFEYRDVQSGELLGYYESYLGQGGLLSRTLGFTRSQPLTGSFVCVPEDEGLIPQKYGFVLVQ